MACMSPVARVVSFPWLAAMAICIAPSLSAQLVELRDYHGKEITCVRSGLHGFEMPCGIQSSYQYIFIGTVVSVSEAEDSERALRVTPEEVFSGSPPVELTVTTSQGDCLGDIALGDKWLFYLRRDENTGTLMLAYGSPSGPVADTEKMISLLRRLIKMTDAGVILGFVGHPVEDADHTERWSYPSGHKVVAKRVEDGTDHVAVTGALGNYEFDLPVGSYDLTANTTQGLWAEEGRIKVEPHGCSSVGFELHPDSSISGWVTNVRGKPVRYAHVQIAPLDGQARWGIATVDEHGYFEVKGLEPGRYLVGIDIQDSQGGLLPQAKAYYPGVRDRDLAVGVALGRGEKRMHIDFSLPR
jgi:hypothetical protein